MPLVMPSTKIIDGKRYALLDSFTKGRDPMTFVQKREAKNTINQMRRRFQKYGYSSIKVESWVTPMRGGNITTTYFYGRKGK